MNNHTKDPKEAYIRAGLWFSQKPLMLISWFLSVKYFLEGVKYISLFLLVSVAHPGLVVLRSSAPAEVQKQG